MAAGGDEMKTRCLLHRERFSLMSWTALVYNLASCVKVDQAPPSREGRSSAEHFRRSEKPGCAERAKRKEPLP
jgi:hypothetical protein